MPAEWPCRGNSVSETAQFPLLLHLFQNPQNNQQHCNSSHFAEAQRSDLICSKLCRYLILELGSELRLSDLKPCALHSNPRGTVYTAKTRPALMKQELTVKGGGSCEKKLVGVVMGGFQKGAMWALKKGQDMARGWRGRHWSQWTVWVRKCRAELGLDGSQANDQSCLIIGSMILNKSQIWEGSKKTTKVPH